MHRRSSADTFPPARRGMAFAAYGIVVVFAPAIGPTLGGWITDNFTWRWVFLLDVPVGILLSLLAGARARPRRSATSFYNVKEFAFVDGRSLGFPPKDLHNLEAMPPEDLDPCYEDRGTTYHRVERLEGLLLAEPLHPFHQELQ